MRQNTSSPRTCLPFQCFHTCAAPSGDCKTAVLFVRGVNPSRLSVRIVAFPEHEPAVREMLYTGSRSGIHRFEAKVPLDHGSNLQRYCFRIQLFAQDDKRPADVVWYSSLGMSRERPLFQHCFAFELEDNHPQWVYSMICYQILPDRFANSRGYFTVDNVHYHADTAIHTSNFEYKDLNQIHCGGNLDGLSDMLFYLRSVGFDCLYLTPIFSANSTDKSDPYDYDSVDAQLGGNGALRRLRAMSVGYEMKIILNGPFNHTGDTHPWFDRLDKTGKGAMHHEDSPYRDYYSFNAANEASCFHHQPSQPRLNYGSEDVRRAMFINRNSVVKKWLKLPYCIDGWCIDAASQLGDDGCAKNNLQRIEEICAAAREVHPQCLMLGEFQGDARYALNADNSLDGAINYTGFTSPIRAFFGGINLRGDPTPYTGVDLQRTCENYAVGMAQQVKLCLINQLDNHNLPRFFSIIGGDKNLYKSAIAAMYAWRGVPCIYQGDELGDVLSSYEIGARDPLPFLAMKDHEGASKYSHDLQRDLIDLAAMRRANPALTHGTQVFITAGGAYFGFIRLYANRFAIVLVNASRQAMTIEQGSILFPLLAAMYLPTDSIISDQTKDSGENTLIPLSGRNVRRTDHGEGLEALYDLLSREHLTVRSFGLKRWSKEFQAKAIAELTAGKTITMPARSTVIINNEDRKASSARL